MLRKINLQHFAEGDGAGEGSTGDGATGQKAKTYSEDYVATLRQEAKENRIKAKHYEAGLRKTLDIPESEDIGDLTARIATYQQAQKTAAAETIQKANAKIIAAEIKSLSGFDAKLIDRLLDKSKISVSEDGAVVGLKEAVEALSVEFPQVKAAKAPATPQTPPPAGNPPPTNESEMGQLEAAHTEAMKMGKVAEAIALKNKMFELSRKTV